MPQAIFIGECSGQSANNKAHSPLDTHVKSAEVVNHHNNPFALLGTPFSTSLVVERCWNGDTKRYDQSRMIRMIPLSFARVLFHLFIKVLTILLHFVRRRIFDYRWIKPVWGRGEMFSSE